MNSSTRLLNEDDLDWRENRDRDQCDVLQVDVAFITGAAINLFVMAVVIVHVMR